MAPDCPVLDKQAYKAKVKQNHPDRVHDMSPAFKRLAEAKTKKLNGAYSDSTARMIRLDCRRSVCRALRATRRDLSGALE